MTLSHHYPERLGRLLLINPPRLFDVLLGACRPFVSKRTMDKLCSIHGSADDVIAHMTTVHGFDETTTSWFREVCLGVTARCVVVMVVIVMAVVAMVVVATLRLSMWQWQLVVPCSLSACLLVSSDVCVVVRCFWLSLIVVGEVCWFCLVSRLLPGLCMGNWRESLCMCVSVVCVPGPWHGVSTRELPALASLLARFAAAQRPVAIRRRRWRG